jgi:4-amino-4-deoxy-L-arabinose transferase-like glycosyltransferase
MLDRLTSWWGQKKQTGFHPLALNAVIALGIFLRLNGWVRNRQSLWLDEALWADNFLDKSLLGLGIRPVGYVALTRGIVRVLGVTEASFRLLSVVAAILSLALVPYVISQLVSSKWLRLLAVLMFAIHPVLVDFANEFKPYSWEVLIHLVPVAMYLRFRETNREAWLLGLLAYLPIAFLFAYNIAFAMPGVLVLALLTAWRSPRRRRLLAATLASGAACAVLCALMFQLSLKTVTRGQSTENYWGQKYDVFFEKSEKLSRVDWTVKKLTDVAAFVSQRRNYWTAKAPIEERTAENVASIDRLFWAGLAFLGGLSLWRGRRDLLLVLLGPVVVMVLGNFAGKWPLGAFRTNLFVLAYTLPLPFLGMQLVATTRARWRAIAAIVIGLTLVPGFAFGFDWHGNKRTLTRNFYCREVIDRLHAERQAFRARHPDAEPVVLLADLHSSRPLDFYLHKHRTYRARYEKFFEENFRIKRMSRGNLRSQAKKLISAARQRKQGIWVVVSSANTFEDVEQAMAGSRIVLREIIGGEHLVMYVESRDLAP